MNYKASTVKEYIDQLPDERKAVIKKLRAVINKNLPKGFKEQIQYSMPGWVVPFSKYPDGYHVSKGKDPLPFINIASQKAHVALYHSGVYAKPELYDWWVENYPKHAKRKLNMGKSCVRFKYLDDIPYDLIGELASKLTVDDWITTYEEALKK